MRVVIHAQMNLGEIDIASIQLDPKSRDDIPKIVRGLQFIYTETKLRESVFSILREIKAPRVGGEGQADAQLGRPGMEQWTTLVLGMLRQGLNADADRLHELANQHSTIRQMLGHGDWADTTRYSLQAIKDNLKLLTPELLDRINQEVVRAGHAVLKKSAETGLNVRADSFVVETDVHFPTDINLLLDAIRVVVETCGKASAERGWSDWRKHAHHLRQFRKAYFRLQRMRYSNSKDLAKKQAKEAEVRQGYAELLEHAAGLFEKASLTRDRLKSLSYFDMEWSTIDAFIQHGERQIDQIRRRVLNGEAIPHDEKVFSLFQPHTEWISKGKAGVPVELGVRVAIVEDQYRFILHHMVMEKTTDDKVAIVLIEETKKRFGPIDSASFDKGFHSQPNQAALNDLVPLVVMPKKGKLSKADKARESNPEFIRLRRKHSGVESAINGLESDGLDRCPDDGIVGFKRYVAMAVVARNVQRLGAILRQREQAAHKKRQALRKAA